MGQIGQKLKTRFIYNKLFIKIRKRRFKLHYSFNKRGPHTMERFYEVITLVQLRKTFKYNGKYRNI